MKHFFIFIALLICVSSSAQNFKIDKFSPRLMNEISSRGVEDIDVFIVLESQLDIQTLLDSFELNQISIHDRAVIINKQLRAIAAESQSKIFPDLENIGIRNYKPFWVVNSIYFKANFQQLQSLSLNTDIRYIDLNAELVIDEAEIVTADIGNRSNSRELGLEVIKAPEMWARGYTGYGTKAFVMDTGVDINHPALGRNYAGNVVPDDQAWFGFRDGNNRPYDCQNHGSHVTGTILGVDRKNQDTIGVAFNAMWMGAPILLVCGGNTEIRMAGFQWALDPDGNPNTSHDMPDVINNSWTDTNVDLCYEVYTQLFTVLEAAGMAVVFAAGNDGPGVGTISAPKNINVSLVNTFAVGAVNANNLDIANFSSRGPSACGGEGSLLIKPEVSAPGVSVRSSVPGNEYSEFNGTSMAAPHVAGAILLLKEAFPFLSGVEIKLALYFSAIDLGEPGEDNVYGMGLIDVDAAYNYLILQGNVPVSPQTNNDLALTEWDYKLDYCSGNLTFNFDIVNQGLEIIDTILLEFFENEDALLPFYSYEVAQNLGNGERTYVNLELLPGEEGVFQWMIRASPKNRIDERPLNNTVKMFVNFEQVEDWTLDINKEEIEVDLCGGTNVILQNLNDEGTLIWYDDSVSINPIFIGNTFLNLLPNQDSTITLYAGFQRDSVIYSRGLEVQDFIPASRSGVIFKTLQDVVVESFEFEVNQRGLFNVAIANEANNLIWTSNKIYEVGVNVLEPNITLQKGLNYTIFIAGNRSVNAQYFDSSDTDIAGYVNTIGTLNNNEFDDDLFTPIANIGFSYEVPCSRKPVLLNVIATENTPTVDFRTDPDTLILAGKPIQFVNESVGAISYDWQFGDGSSSNEISPVHTFTNPGEYDVILTVKTLEGCSNSYLLTIEVLEDTEVNIRPSELNYSIHIYPNPSQNEINIDWDENTAMKSIELISLSGNIIFKNKSALIGGNFRFDLTNSSVTSGIYILRLILNDGSIVNRRIVKI